MLNKPTRKIIRLKDYDYSQAGCHFITICTNNRELMFGDIVDGIMYLNEYGKIVENELIKTAEKRPYITIDNYVIMPNHVHIIISLICDKKHTSGEAGKTEEADTSGEADTARRVPTEYRI